MLFCYLNSSLPKACRDTLLILRLGQLALLVRFSAKKPAISMAIVIIPNMPIMFNKNRPFFEKNFRILHFSVDRVIQRPYNYIL